MSVKRERYKDAEGNVKARWMVDVCEEDLNTGKRIRVKKRSATWTKREALAVESKIRQAIRHGKWREHKEVGEAKKFKQVA